MYNRTIIYSVIMAGLLSLSVFAQKIPVKDSSFDQLYSETFILNDTKAGEIFCIGPGPVLGTSTGIWEWDGNSFIKTGFPVKATFDISLTDSNKIKSTAGLGGLYSDSAVLFNQHILATAGDTDRKGRPQFIVGSGTVWKWNKKSAAYYVIAENLPRAVHDAVISPSDSSLWIATGMGLCHINKDSYRLYQRPEDILTSSISAVEFDHQGRLWAGGYGGISIFQSGIMQETITPAEGLPMLEVTSLAKGDDNTMWIGMAKSLASYDGEDWAVYFSKRWLPDDRVIGVTFDNGTLWAATPKGVSAFKSRETTLANKSEYFHDVAMARHFREPGFIEKCNLTVPGKLDEWFPEDDDNDGEYTAEWLVMQSFRYAATGSKEAKQRADHAFQALKFLQTVTETDGFFARTVVPPDWTHPNDPNRTYTEEEIELLSVLEPRFKPVEIRWHPTADGKWLWKGDTSSDEMCGHFYGYYMYYDLVCDAEQKKIVADHTAKIMDYLMVHDYNFIDVDGKHTRWGVWSPDMLNNDPEWAAERGINAAELLSYLLATWHMTGDEKYRKEYKRLLYEENFIEHVKQAKTFAPAWNTHIDDTLLVKVFPALLLYETEPELLKIYRQAFEDWYAGIRNEDNPYFNFTYNWLADNTVEMDRSLFFLRDCPTDLINWRIDQSWREDLQVVRKPIWEKKSMSRLVPPSERAVIRWDKNPWMIARGDGGRTEWAPTFWLLPYWMGRHLGYIGN